MSIITSAEKVYLGIDPGTARVGYGVITKNRGKLTHVESGLVDLPEKIYEKRLVVLEKKIRELVRKTEPHRVGLERLFFTKNQKTAMRVAEARGVILKTLVEEGLSLRELGPSEIKLAVTGDGKASKGAVQKMVRIILKLGPRKMIDDVSDALAVAIAVSGNDIETRG